MPLPTPDEGFPRARSLPRPFTRTLLAGHDILREMPNTRGNLLWHAARMALMWSTTPERAGLADPDAAAAWVANVVSAHLPLAAG